MFIELHILQNFAPSNLNRDDTGSPKDCVFGGVRRARISSQCLKRAMRETDVFAETTKLENGTRTKYLIQKKLKEGLSADKATHTEADAILTKLVADLFSKMDGNDKTKTAVLLYISDEEIKAIGATLESNWGALTDSKQRDGVIVQLVKELAKQFKDRTSAPDIALFGRMLAEHPDLNIHAASQVAHAISTHRISMEMDFYTAVDELNTTDSGAGMMGFTGYDSACFYRYARIDWGQLYKNLDKNTALTRQTVEGFLRAAFDAIPSGKQNGFAAYNPPSLMLAVVRKAGMGWSLANAFERPVSPERNSGGYVTASVKSLDDYWQRLATVYGDKNLAHVAVLPLDANLPLVNLADKQVASFDQLVAGILNVLPSNGGAA